MKKISYILSTLALAFAFVGCSETEDDNPVLNTQPEAGGYQEFLNVPEYANQYLTLTKDTEGGILNMTCSQPDYGFAAAATYSVEVSFTPFDVPSQGEEGEGEGEMTRDDEVPDQDTDQPEDGGEDGEGLPTSVILSTTFHDCAAINVPNSELASAIAAMLGIDSPDVVPSAYAPLYVRLIAQIYNGSNLVPNTTIYSNYITLKGVSLTYVPAVEPNIPSGIYLRGGMNNWGNDPGFADETKWQFLSTTEAGVYIIEDAEIPAKTEFKVAAMDWGDPNAGYNGSDLQLNTPYTMNNAGSSSNITCPEDFMGDVQLVVKGGNYTITLIPYEKQEAGVKSGIYLIGSMTDWGFDASYEFLTAAYVGYWSLTNVSIPAGAEFKIAALGWGDPNCGLMAGKDLEVGVAYTLFNDGASGNLTFSNGASFNGNVNLKLKNGDYIVTFVPYETE